MSFCPHCGANAAPGSRYCANCGRSIATSTTYEAAPAYTPTYMPGPAPAPAPVAAPRQGVSEGIAIAALILNILVWPGLGSLVAGSQKGWAQGFLFLGGLLLTLTLVAAILGIPMMIGAWIWGIVTGIELIQGRER